MKRGPKPGVVTEPPTTIQLVLTADQARDFARCARVSGVATVEEWIIECARVQAANAIDALQADERRRRAADRAEAGSKAVNVRRRQERRAIGSKDQEP